MALAFKLSICLIFYGEFLIFRRNKKCDHTDHHDGCGISTLMLVSQRTLVQFPDSMGVYKYYMSFNGPPAYHKTNGRRLYFLAGSGWLVGTQVGAQTGFLHHASQYRDGQNDGS